jgi:UDP-N-acetylglucosamine 4,6-dehydratase/5-epimerase
MAERDRLGAIPSFSVSDMTPISGRAVLVTGASGSLGLALIRRLGGDAPSEIRAFQRNANGADRLRHVLEPRVPLHVISGDVADCDAVAAAMVGIDVVFHLAALKDIVACEENAELATRTNVRGSEAVVRAATRLGTHVVVVAASTDKASQETTVLGRTKALMERMICASGVGSSVRLGGVLGSTGSVLEAWRRSARERGVIEVTDPEMTRFAMTQDEAVTALMFACERGRSGEILIPTMRSYKLGDLATAFARANDVELMVIGLRRGEQRHADALSAAELESAGRDGAWRILIPGRQLGGVAPYRSNRAERFTPAELEQIVGAVAA